MIYDYIIVGTGIAGLNTARLIPKDKKVLVLCKQSPWECNTFYAQGGIATVVDDEDIDSHIQDTLKAGVYHNKQEAVELLSKLSQEALKDLISNGFEFDLDEHNNLAYTKEAAHSKSRILHADGDATGRMLHMFLLKECPHAILENAVVNDLLIKDNICYGVQYFTNETNEKISYGHNIILASGGIGSLYKYHTNSPAISGEIHGICLEKGIKLKDMEMMQFHPTVFKGTSYARKPLLSEALRGEGAYVIDEDGKRFLFDYHEDAELAPRDIVSRAIFDYAKKTNKQIYLSFKKFKKTFFKKRFPNIYSNLRSLGYELPFENVPISPAFHYAMGGVNTTLEAKVDNFLNLYAIGELACSGVHGANRLASNSLLEGLVFSKIAVDVSLKEDFKINLNNYTKKVISYKRNENIDKNIKDLLRHIMWNSASIVRETKKLEDALTQINIFLQEDVGRLLFLRLLTAQSILKSSIERDSSLGVHYIKEN